MKEYKCGNCGAEIPESKVSENVKKGDARAVCEKCYEPDWSRSCENCGASPVVPLTGLCGPCTWGETDTMGGNW